MTNNQTISILSLILLILGIVFVVLLFIFIFISWKSRTKKNKVKINKSTNNKKNEPKTTTISGYNKQSIFNFMEFDRVDDNMIIQNNEKRFLMAIECQGINYDLMSGLEKNSVEQGFLQFLNILRYPIQLYIQTRTVNLGSSINTYKDRMRTVGNQLNTKQIEYNQKMRSGNYTENELKALKFELVRLRNLYEYGNDIVSNTERMSLNRNILSKHYYVIISYYAEELGGGNFDKQEIKNMAFSELYTKAQTLISALSVCGINSKVLNSYELTELLYVAYNRDESEVYDLNRVLNAGYEDLYSTAPDVFSRRIKELDKKIQEDAMQKANDTVFKVVEETEMQKKAREKEQHLQELIDEMSKMIIDENESVIGRNIAQKSKQRIDEEAQNRKEGEKNEEKQTKSSRKSNTVQ